MSGQKRTKKWRFGDFEVPPDWKEGVKSKNCYDRSISRAKLPPCTNFQRKIRQNVIGFTLGFFCTSTHVVKVSLKSCSFFMFFNFKLDFYCTTSSYCYQNRRNFISLKPLK